MKFALEVIERMKSGWAKRSLKRRTWSKGNSYFEDGIP